MWGWTRDGGCADVEVPLGAPRLIALSFEKVINLLYNVYIRKIKKKEKRISYERRYRTVSCSGINFRRH